MDSSPFSDIRSAPYLLVALLRFIIESGVSWRPDLADKAMSGGLTGEMGSVRHDYWRRDTNNHSGRSESERRRMHPR